MMVMNNDDQCNLNCDQETEFLATLLCQHLKKKYFPVRVMWNRRNVINTIEGVITDVYFVHRLHRRKGGGFVFKMNYMNMVEEDHTTVLTRMLFEYLQQLETQKITVKNKNTNINKDVVIYIDNKWVSINAIFPWQIRTLDNFLYCYTWLVNQRLMDTYINLETKIKKNIEKKKKKKK